MSGDADRPRRRRWAWGPAVALLACGAFVIWRPAPRAAAPPPTLPEALEPTTPLPEPGPDVPEAVRRYLEHTVYPPSSGPLSPDHEDSLFPNRRYERMRLVGDPHGPHGAVAYELSADRFDVTGDERVRVWLEVQRGGEPIDPAWIEAQLLREGRGGPEGDPVELRFRRQRARWETSLPLDLVEDHHGFLVVDVRFAYAPEAEHRDTLRFFHTPADRVPARFTERFHDYVRDGDLRVEVGLDVAHEGFYRLDANFYRADGEPVAFAAFKGELSAGDQTVPLSVFGKVLRDAGAAGPFTMAELRGYRFVDGGFPDRETIPASDARWTTGRYSLAEFSEDVWDSPDKRRMLELLQRDAEAGIGLGVPGLPAGPAQAAPAEAR